MFHNNNNRDCTSGYSQKLMKVRKPAFYSTILRHVPVYCIHAHPEVEIMCILASTASCCGGIVNSVHHSTTGLQL